MWTMLCGTRRGLGVIWLSAHHLLFWLQQRYQGASHPRRVPPLASQTRHTTPHHTTPPYSYPYRLSGTENMCVYTSNYDANMR